MRENCADMAIDADAIDEGFIARCRALSITGTHLSTPGTRTASQKALGYAARYGVVRVPMVIVVIGLFESGGQTIVGAAGAAAMGWAVPGRRAATSRCGRWR
jgi:hypothetical protein